MGAAAALGIFLVALARHLSFHSTAYDLGFFDQAIWNAAHGRGFISSYIPYDLQGEHLEPVLWVFAYAYRFGAASPGVLLLAQSLALGFAVVPVVLLAREWLGPRWAWAGAVAYLAQPALWGAVLFDFHPEALAVPFVLWALVAASRRRDLWMTVCAMVPALCKEDGALVTLALGLLVWLALGRRLGLAIAAAGLAWGLVAVLVVMPGLRRGAPSDLVARYGYLGGSPRDVILHLVTRPGLVLEHVVHGPGLLALLAALLAVGLLPLLRPLPALLALLPAVPALASTQSYQAALALHYGLPALPLLVAAALLGAQRALQPAARWRAEAVVAAVLASSSIIALVVSGSLARSLPFYLRDLGRAPDAATLLARIPSDAPVAASGSLLPHLGHRHQVWELPAGMGTAWLAMDSLSSSSSQSRGHGYGAIAAQLAGRGYQLLGSSGGVSLWRRGP